MAKSTFFFLVLFFCNLAVADIFKYVDADGRVYYTDEPRHGLYKRIIKTSPYRYKVKENSGASSYPTIFSQFSNNYRSNYSYGTRSNDKSRFSNVIAAAASRHRVDEKLVHAVIQTESSYNPNAVSHAGAVGLMQLMPDTARRYGVTNRSDPAQNIDGGTRYLKDLLDMFNYNLGLAVAAYNAGENAVIKYNNSIPPYPETRNYVRQVLARYNRLL